MATKTKASVFLDSETQTDVHKLETADRWAVSVADDHGVSVLNIHGTTDELRAMAQQILDEIPVDADRVVLPPSGDNGAGMATL